MRNRWSGARVMLASKHRWSRSSRWLHIQRHNREWRRLHVGSSQWLHVWSRPNKWWLCGLCLCYYNRILWCSDRIHGYRVRRHLWIHTMNGDSIENILRLYRFTNNQTDDKLLKITKKCPVNYRIKNGYQGPKKREKIWYYLTSSHLYIDVRYLLPSMHVVLWVHVYLFLLQMCLFHYDSILLTMLRMKHFVDV